MKIIMIQSSAEGYHPATPEDLKAIGICGNCGHIARSDEYRHITNSLSGYCRTCLQAASESLPHASWLTLADIDFWVYAQSGKDKTG